MKNIILKVLAIISGYGVFVSICMIEEGLFVRAIAMFCICALYLTSFFYANGFFLDFGDQDD